MKESKVYGGNLDGIHRVLVCARTKKRAVELLKEISRGRIFMWYFNNYFSETGNKIELSIATHEGVWKGEKMVSDSFEEVK